jgi:hypothetical protein
MKIEYLRTVSAPDRNNLMVSFSEPTPNVLRTFIGEFTAGGVRVEMNEEWLYEVPVNPEVRMCIIGSLVQHRKSGDWAVFVDEWYANGEDQVYRFDQTSPYKLFSHVFVFDLPAGAQNLDDVTIKVMTIESLPKETADAAGSES